MRICESAKKCTVDQCKHKAEHGEYNDTHVDNPNICRYPCDVDGGIPGSVCVDSGNSVRLHK